MKATVTSLCVVSIAIAVLSCEAAAKPLAAPEPIKTVTLGANREFLVNGRPFFPIMSWAQDNKRYPLLRSVGINTFVGGDDNTAANLRQAQAAGGYHVPHFGGKAIGHPYQLGWIHSDEPDLPRSVQDIELTCETMRPHNLRRLGRFFDGNADTRASLEPLEGLVITARWPSSRTVVKFRIRQGNDSANSLVQIKDIELSAGGRKLAAATLERNSKWQTIPLPVAASFDELTIRVRSIYPGEGAEAVGYEFEGLDAAGTNVLAAPRRRVPKMTPAEVMANYRKIRAVDTTRPLLMTLTAGFMKVDTRHSAEIKATYPDYIKATDVVGFDFYPIYGYNKPEWISRPGEGVGELVQLAGHVKPVYAWIETSKGSRWITYSKQHDVLPKHTRAEVWMSICNGATAIGYFTHAWRPKFTEFAPTDAMRAELIRLNGQITRLAGPILAPTSTRAIAIAAAGETPVLFKATEYDGALYIFTQNPTHEPRAAKITIEGVADGTSVDVVDESRTLTLSDGDIEDSFAPLAEHIYRVQLGGR